MRSISLSILILMATNGILTNGLKFLNTPYVANTLEVNEQESLVIDTGQVDCTTLVEYVLAQTLPGDFAGNLQRIRYRDGKIDGYTSRLHYISDWINNGVRHEIIEDVTAANTSFTGKLELSFMSTHPQLYKSLKNSPENVRKMAAYEKALKGQVIHFLPKDQVKAEGFPWIRDGDVIALMTNIPGLDVSHMGIAVYQEDKLHLLHASSTERKVVISKYPLSEMMDRNKSWTGIRVLRMKQ